ncbi:MAG: hypothetical protein J6A15_03995 [Clostridia bacterium]|nr:hypothetical protein [Clostridia bacterium]
MKGKIKFLAIALLTSIVMNSQVFAVTYQPNKDVNINKDNIESLEEYYTKEDAVKAFEIYKYNKPTEEELEKYDMNKDGLVNSYDVAVILNLTK